MKNKTLVLLLAAVVAVALGACHPDHGKPPIGKKEMTSLLIDLHTVQTLMKVTIDQKDFKRNPYYRQVLDEHNVSPEDFDSAVSWYSRNADDYKRIYKVVVDSLERRRDRVKK